MLSARKVIKMIDLIRGGGGGGCEGGGVGMECMENQKKKSPKIDQEIFFVRNRAPTRSKEATIPKCKHCISVLFEGFIYSTLS